MSRGSCCSSSTTKCMRAMRSLGNRLGLGPGVGGSPAAGGRGGGQRAATNIHSPKPWLRPPSWTPHCYLCHSFLFIESLHLKSLSYMNAHLPSLNGNQCDVWVKGDPPKIAPRQHNSGALQPLPAGRWEPAPRSWLKGGIRNLGGGQTLPCRPRRRVRSV